MMKQRQPRRGTSTLPALRMGTQNRQGEANRDGQTDANASSGTSGENGAPRNAPPSGSASGAFADTAYFSDIVGKRIIAHIVDSAILLAIMLPLGFFMVLGAVATLGLLAIPFAFAFLALRFIYYVSFTAGPRSATPGMRLLGIELRRVDGGRPDFLQAFLRLSIYYVSVALLTPLILLAVLFNDQRRTLHDLLSETLVVNRPSSATG